MSNAEPALTPAQAAMVRTWEAHTAAEFKSKDLDATLATMTTDPSVNHFAVMTGGVGLAGVRAFYGRYFIPSQPPDTEIVSIARTVGTNRVVDELLHRFTHTVPMPWLLPGVPPTGARVELAVVVVAEFEGDKIVNERIYWDQASLLVQVGLLRPDALPVVGVESAHKLADRTVPPNRLIERAEAKK